MRYTNPRLLYLLLLCTRAAVWADQPTVTAAAMLHSGLCLHLYSERLQHSVACVIDRADNRR